MERSDLTVLDDPRAVARHVAAWLVEKLNTGVKRARGVCLSGGATPRLLYETLAQRPYSEAMPWQRIHWFWCDERWVPHTDERSNYNMTRHQLFSRAPIPNKNIHAPVVKRLVSRSIAESRPMANAAIAAPTIGNFR